MHILLDADFLKYRWCYGDYTLREVKDKVQDFMENLYQTYDPDGLTMCMSSGTNFRDVVSSVYKAKRPEKPPLHDHVRDYVEDKYGAYIRKFDWVEADDTASLMQTAGKRGTVIASQDKDLLQVPGSHIRLFQKSQLFVDLEVSEEEGYRMLWQQALTGDATDNIQGCIGAGAKAGDDFGESLTYVEAQDWVLLCDLYVATLEKCRCNTRKFKLLQLECEYGTDDLYAIAYWEAYKTMLLVRMLRHGEYDWNTGELSLWKPPLSYKEYRDASKSQI